MIRRPRLLPPTIAAMLGLLLLKSVGLVQAAQGPGDAPKTPAMAPAAPAAAANPGPVAGPPKAAAMPKPDAPAPVSAAERALLLDLRHRREELDTRARALEARGAVLEAAEHKLAGRVEELSDLQARLEALERERRLRDSANWTGLVRIYEAMKPRDAAAIFDSLDMQVLLGVLDRMQERRAAPILAAMQPDRARLATQMLAELRVKSTAAR